MHELSENYSKEQRKWFKSKEICKIKKGLQGKHRKSTKQEENCKVLGTNSMVLGTNSMALGTHSMVLGTNWTVPSTSNDQV